jgi:hypothetical protein
MVRARLQAQVITEAQARECGEADWNRVISRILYGFERGAMRNGSEHEDYRDMVDVGLDESSGLEDECLFTGPLMFDMKSMSTT